MDTTWIIFELNLKGKIHLSIDELKKQNKKERKRGWARD